MIRNLVLEANDMRMRPNIRVGELSREINALACCETHQDSINLTCVTP